MDGMIIVDGIMSMLKEVTRKWKLIEIEVPMKDCFMRVDGIMLMLKEGRDRNMRNVPTKDCLTMVDVIMLMLKEGRDLNMGKVFMKDCLITVDGIMLMLERRKGWEPGQLSGIYEFYCTGCGNKFNYYSFYMQWNKPQQSKKYREISFMV